MKNEQTTNKMRGVSCHECVDGRWQKVAQGKGQGKGCVGEQLKMVTLNVLFSHWRGKEYHHEWVIPVERYACILDRLVAMDADIITLNECTPMFAEQLCKHDKIAQTHYLGGLDTLGDGGNLLLVRKAIGVPSFFAIDLPRLPRPAIACRLPGLLVCGAHLTALTMNHQRRAEQLHALTSTLEGEASDVPLMVICGDLNFHNAAVEDANIPAGWLDTPYDGFSFDASRNPMHAILWPLGFESRQMRLDRVLVRGAGGLAKNCQLAFEEPIYPDSPILESPSLMQRTLWQLGWSQPDPRSYLRCSDHFGLTFTLLLQ